jgi:hypothetical protein
MGAGWNSDCDTRGAFGNARAERAVPRMGARSDCMSGVAGRGATRHQRHAAADMAVSRKAAIVSILRKRSMSRSCRGRSI